MSDIYDALRVDMASATEISTYRERDDEGWSGKGAMTATEAAYPPASSGDLAHNAQELRSNANAQRRRIETRLKQNEEERRELSTELERICDLINRLEERKNLVGSTARSLP